MPWLILIFSGALQAVWAAALYRASRASGRQRIGPAAIFLVSVAASLGGLTIAMQSIPTRTAYAAWVGVGLVLTSAYAILIKAESPTATRLLLLSGIAACVVGLKVLT